MSTESGVPDFRSPGGIWSRFQPVYFDQFMASRDARHEYWRQKCLGHREFAHAQPNDGHRCLAKWQQNGVLSGVVTQNIDGLHQLAGSDRVLEIHGTARQAACMRCGERQPIEPLVQQFEDSNVPPDCDCGGPMKHATISFGQPLDQAVWDQAAEWMSEADLVLVLGSSLSVYPAAQLPQLAVQAGAKCVIINRDPTELDSMADIVVNASLGQTLGEIDSQLQQLG